MYLRGYPPTARTREFCLILLFLRSRRRGGILVHIASKATLRDCSVVGSCLAGVDVRTGAEATVEALCIQGGRASGM